MKFVTGWLIALVLMAFSAGFSIVHTLPFSEARLSGVAINLSFVVILLALGCARYAGSFVTYVPGVGASVLLSRAMLVFVLTALIALIVVFLAPLMMRI